jgi:hypothetical protein
MTRSNPAAGVLEEDWGSSDSEITAITAEDWGSSFPEIKFTPDTANINMPQDVTFWGEAPAVSRPLLVSIERLSKADPKNVQELAASQVQLLDVYHQIVLGQSRRSFWWALAGACSGLVFFMAAIGFTILTGNAVAASIPVISGAVIEVVSGVVFLLYGKATTQLSEFYNRLETLQRYLLANSICESLATNARDKARATLIAEISSERANRTQGANKRHPIHAGMPKLRARAEPKTPASTRIESKPIDEC